MALNMEDMILEEIMAGVLLDGELCTLKHNDDEPRADECH
jgi:hypothetical protein